MDQKQILSLLQEAASDDCTSRRANEIQCELEHATAAMTEKGYYAIDIPASGIQIVLAHLYLNTYQENRALLPTLFPAFAIMCGNRDKNSLLADIDWSVMAAV